MVRVARRASIAALLALVAAFFGRAGPAEAANSTELRNLVISGASCRAIGQTLGRSGVVEFRGAGVNVAAPAGVSAVLKLHCALPSSHVRVAARDPVTMSSYRVAYRDSDGAGGVVDVFADLRRTSLTATGQEQDVRICAFRSSAQGTGSTLYTTATVPCAHALTAGGVYYFNVLLVASAPLTTSFAELVAISFP